MKSIPNEILDDTDFTFSEHFSYIKVLGRGSFGYVVLGANKITLEIMAVKVTNFTKQIIEKSCMGEEDIEQIKNEARLLEFLDHPHIVRYKQVIIFIYQFLESENKFYLAMEYLCGGSLDELIRMHNNTNHLSSEEGSEIIKEILEAVLYMHSHNTIHRDLKQIGRAHV